MTHRIAISAAIVATLALGCGQSAVIQCKVAAVEKLPADPLSIDGHDVSNLVARLQNCEAPSGGADAGAP